MHISRVRSTELDKWSQQELELLDSMGNAVANSYWEANLPASHARPKSTDLERLERFIRQKYEHRAFVSSEFNPYNESSEQRKTRQPERSSSATQVQSKSSTSSLSLPTAAPAPSLQQQQQQADLPDLLGDAPANGGTAAATTDTGWAAFDDNSDAPSHGASNQENQYSDGFDLLQQSTDGEDDTFAAFTDEQQNSGKPDKSDILSLYDSSSVPGMQSMQPVPPQQQQATGPTAAAGLAMPTAAPAYSATSMQQQPTQPFQQQQQMQSPYARRASPFSAQAYLHPSPMAAAQQEQVPQQQQPQQFAMANGFGAAPQQQTPAVAQQQQEQQNSPQQAQMHRRGTFTGSPAGPKGSKKKVSSGISNQDIDIDPFS